MPVVGLRRVCVRVRAEHGLFPAGPYGLRESAVWGGAHGMLRIPQEQGAVTAMGRELGCRPPRPHSPAAEKGHCHQQGALWGASWRRQLCHGSQRWGSLPRPAGPERSGLDSVPSWAHRPLSMQGLGSWYPKPATPHPHHALVLKVESTCQAV